MLRVRDNLRLSPQYRFSNPSADSGLQRKDRRTIREYLCSSQTRSRLERYCLAMALVLLYPFRELTREIAPQCEAEAQE